jgi:hypothetical protein
VFLSTSGSLVFSGLAGTLGVIVKRATHATPVAFATGAGTLLVGITASALGAPRAVMLVGFGIGLCLLIVAGLWWYQERNDPRRDQLSIASRQIGTELRDIRHKIEIVRATRPTRHYGAGFRLPGARWDEYDEVLAANPALYATVERAYTAAHHVNEAVDMRRTRAKPGMTLGVIAEDGLDEAYDAAGDALDALREPRGEPFESDYDRAVRLVTEDVVRDGA